MTTLYRALQTKRDWLLAKIEYLQTESARWRTLFALIVSPYKLLRLTGIPPSACIGVLLALVGGGSYVAADVMLEGKSFARGDPGVYAAPGDIPTFYDSADNTLRVDLGTTPVGEISISDITVGTAFAGSTLPSGQTNVLYIGGLPTSSGFTATFIEVGHLIVDRLRCTKLTLSTIEAHELNVKFNASDGQSISAVAGTPRARAIGGGNRADAMTTSGGYYDQIKLQAPNSGVNGKVDVLRLSNIYTKGGPCVVTRIKAGTVDIIFNELGAGDGFAAKDFIIEDSVIYQTFNNVDNVEVSISPP
jgi:hypothetical protein